MVGKCRHSYLSLFKILTMEPNKYTKVTVLLICISIFFSCAAKEAPEPDVVQDIPKTEVPKETPTVIEQITKKNSVDQVIRKNPKDDETAVTYPRVEKIKKYERANREDTWFLVGGVTGERAYSVFVDPETVENQDGLINSWSKLEFEKTQRDEDGLSYIEVQINSDINCKERTYSYGDSKFYDGLGRLVESQPALYDPLPIVDGTVSAQIADFVCGYDLNRPK